MNKIILYILTLISPIPAYAQYIKIDSTHSIKKNQHRSQTLLISEEKTYTTGGITFTYPECLFTSAPNIDITLEDNPLDPTATYIADVISHTTQSTTVMVFLITFNEGIISLEEAANASVNVLLVANETL